MVVRVAAWVLRISALLALILGILFWVNVAESFIPIHMLLGIIVALSLIVLGIAFATSKGGNWGLAIGAIILALIVVGFGASQQTILVGSLHWLVQVIHLLLGLAAIGMGEAISGRYRRQQLAQTM